MKPIYLDHAATTRVHPEVLAAMLPFLQEDYGNPSSIHAMGRLAREAVEHAREQIAAAIHCTPGELIFTSGGTESDNWAVSSFAKPGARLLCSAVEHHAVLRSMERAAAGGCTTELLRVDGFGAVQPETLAAALEKPAALASVMAANNEVGTLQPIALLASIAHERSCVFHTDAVQAFGSLPVDVEEWQVDMLSLSSHKIHGPKGAGALYLRRGIRPKALLRGGSQERGLRAGTENVPAIVGFGKAAELAEADRILRVSRQRKLRDRLAEGLQKAIPDLRWNGDPVNRLPGNLNIYIPGIDHEALLMRLDLCGICASSGAACTAGSLEPSHVLLAMGMDRGRARGSIRFSLDSENTEAEIDEVIRCMAALAPQLRRTPGGYMP